jgi:butyrate kinase
MDNKPLILAINPGSTSTKIAVYAGDTALFMKNLKHSAEMLSGFEKITDQFQFRKNIIVRTLEDAEIKLSHIKIIMGRGGLLKPIESGVYAVSDSMLRDLRNSPIGEHASNLGGLIANDLARSLPGAQAYIADPVVVDEMTDLARYSGHALLKRKSIFHALNQKAVAREHAKSIMKNYKELNLIVAHLGGGITVGAHRKGKVIDVNQGLDGDGPFSPERSGTLPVGDLVRLCFSGQYTQQEVMAMIKGKGGLVSYTGTNSVYDVEADAFEGDERSSQVLQAMAYQVAKEIGAMATVLEGEVDGILITGGIANSKWFVDLIIERVKTIAPVHVYPGEDEMLALAMNGLRVLRGETEIKQYR